MAKLFTILGTDQAREDEGVWTDLGLGLDCEFLIAGYASHRYQAGLRDLQRHDRLAAKQNGHGGEPGEDPMVRVCRFEARDLLLGIKKIEDDDGQPIEDTEDGRFAVLHRMPRIRLLIHRFAAQPRGYRLEEHEDDLKNFKPSSPGALGEDGKPKRNDGGERASETAQ